MTPSRHRSGGVNGIVAFKDHVARSDNPAIANWRKVSAIGMSNNV
jgi:hypothetical protein